MAKHKKPRKPNESQSTESGTKLRKDQSPKVPQRDKIDYPLMIRERDDLTDKQKQLIDLVMAKDTKLVFLAGPAGTSKTFIAIYCGLLLLSKHSVSDILFIRSIVESASKSLGSLPGDQSQKLDPFLMPLYDKLDELLYRADVDRLVKEERVQGLPVNYLRGSSFNAKCVIADESQNFTFKELTTLITRVGKFSKLLVAGDMDQADINGASGFSKMFDLFNDERSRAEGIHCFSFTAADIVRSGLVRYIVERLEEHKIQHTKNEPMFPAKH